MKSHLSLAALWVAILAVSALPDVANAQSKESDAAPLVGTWRVQVTQYNCATKATLATFGSLLTFNSDGTMTEATTNPTLLAGQRTSGHGFWNVIGPRSYSSVTEAFITFDSPTTPPGLKTGSQKILQTIVLDGSNKFSAAAAVRFFTSSGSLYLSGCASAQGVRLTRSLDQP